MDRGQVEGRLYGRNGKLQKQQAAGVSRGNKEASLAGGRGETRVGRALP